MRVDVRELITFYDEDIEARPHANAIKTLAGEELGLAILMEYFRRKGDQVQLLDELCTTGKRRGVRLDGWLRVRNERETVDYQVEVKNWSFHSLGGRQLPLACTAEELGEFKRRTWNDYWMDGRFREPELDKVLTAMRPAPGADRREPLACLWVALHPEGRDEAFFPYPVVGCDFERVWIFSVSGFLRSLRETTLDIDLPIASRRLHRLQRIFSLGGARIPRKKTDGAPPRP